jgi:repressor LexA
MTDLTKAQRLVLEFVQAEQQAGRSAPTLREIAERFGFAGHRAAAVHLAALKRKGFIESDAGKARSLRVTSPLQKLRGRIMDIPLLSRRRKAACRWMWQALDSSRRATRSPCA